MTPPAAAASTARPARPLAPSRPAPSRRPRRVSGPARPRPAREAGSPSQRVAARPREGLLPWLLGALETLSTHRLLDRLIRGRLWIGIIAFALLGIVTLQLGLLKLNSGIGRSLERSTALQRENAALAIENSELTSGERVESQATGKLGMRLGTITGLHALSSSPGHDVHKAAGALQAHAQGASTGTASSSPSTTGSAASSEAAEAAAKAGTGGATAEAHTEAGGSEAEGATSSASGPSGSSASGEGHAASEGGAAGGAGAAGEAGTSGASGASETSESRTTSEAGGGTAGPGG